MKIIRTRHRYRWKLNSDPSFFSSPPRFVRFRASCYSPWFDFDVILDLQSWLGQHQLLDLERIHWVQNRNYKRIASNFDTHYSSSLHGRDENSWLQALQLVCSLPPWSSQCWPRCFGQELYSQISDPPFECKSHRLGFFFVWFKPIQFHVISCLLWLLSRITTMLNSRYWHCKVLIEVQCWRNQIGSEFWRFDLSIFLTHSCLFFWLLALVECWSLRSAHLSEEYCSMFK